MGFGGFFGGFRWGLGVQGGLEGFLLGGFRRGFSVSSGVFFVRFGGVSARWVLLVSVGFIGRVFVGFKSSGQKEEETISKIEVFGLGFVTLKPQDFASKTKSKKQP